MLYARADGSNETSGGTGTSSSSSSLSAGAAAGIAIGAIVLAAVLLGGGWALLRRHRRSIAAATSAGELGKSTVEVNSEEGKPGSGPDSRPSTQNSTLPAGVAPQHRQLLGGLDAAQQVACLQQQQLQQERQQSEAVEPTPETPSAAQAPLAAALSNRSSAEVRPPGWAGWSHRPVLPSPFAAASARRSHELDRTASPQLSPASGEASAATLLVTDEERSEVVEELLQHRALQEAAELTGSLASTTASGGRSSSHSGGAAPSMSQLLAALPSALQQWVVPHSEIEYLKKPDGSLYILGEGARWAGSGHGDVLCNRVRRGFCRPSARLPTHPMPLLCHPTVQRPGCQGALLRRGGGSQGDPAGPVGRGPEPVHRGACRPGVLCWVCAVNGQVRVERVADLQFASASGGAPCTHQIAA